MNMPTRKGLGRNLSALLGSQASTNILHPEHTISMLDIALLKPGKYQPRTYIEEDALKELAESIKKQGILQPIIVRSVPEGGFEIIAGERRMRAAKLAGLNKVPACIREVNDETTMAIALIENIQRADLNAMDKAFGMQRLSAEYKLTHEKIAEVLGQSRSAVTNYLRLLQLAPAVQVLIQEQKLDMGHARAILPLPHADQEKAAEKIISQNLSVRDTEKLVAAWHTPRQAKTASPSIYQDKAIHLSNMLNAKVDIKHHHKGKGRVIIHYTDETQLEGLLAGLGSQITAVD